MTEDWASAKKKKRKKIVALTFPRGNLADGFCFESYINFIVIAEMKLLSSLNYSTLPHGHESYLPLVQFYS